MTKTSKELKRPRVIALVDKINSLDKQERENLASLCNTSLGNLQQVAYGYGGCSPKLARAICKACPDIHISEILTELADLNS